MPPMMMPRLPIAAPAEVLLWAPATRPWKICRGPIAVLSRNVARTCGHTVSRNAPPRDRSRRMTRSSDETTGWPHDRTIVDTVPQKAP